MAILKLVIENTPCCVFNIFCLAVIDIWRLCNPGCCPPPTLTIHAFPIIELTNFWVNTETSPRTKTHRKNGTTQLIEFWIVGEVKFTLLLHELKFFDRLFHLDNRTGAVDQFHLWFDLLNERQNERQQANCFSRTSWHL